MSTKSHLPSILIRLAGAAAAIIATGCANEPPPQTGFLSDYSKLTKAEDDRMRYTSPRLNEYTTFVIDPVRFEENQKSPLSPKQQQEVAAYFNESLHKHLTKGGYTVTETPGPGVARIRVAITGINESAWWMNIHPGTKLTGAGKGGAAMEGEVVDSQTGEQLAAVLQAGKGGQFTLNPFSTIEDVKATIDQWSKTAVDRLNELRKAETANARR